MFEITLITDFYGAFQTKVPSNPYKAGFDLDLLTRYFAEYDINVKIKRYSDFQFFDDYSNKIIIYTSIEDPNGHYRSYIDDILFGLDLAGAIIIPGYRLFKAHENKVFMEILRNLIFKGQNNITSYKIGSFSDFNHSRNLPDFPVIVKKSSGSSSKGVFLAKNRANLINTVRKVSSTNDYWSLLVDFLFSQKMRLFGIKYLNRITLYRKKFIIQNFIEGLPNDYKVLIFDNKYYILKRLNRSNDFKASGSGNFVTSDKFQFSENLLNSCEKWFKSFDVPCASFDVAYKDDSYYLIEFQFVNFGTYTQTSARNFFQKDENKWIKKEESITLEKVYVESIVKYIRRKHIND